MAPSYKTKAELPLLAPSAYTLASTMLERRRKGVPRRRPKCSAESEIPILIYIEVREAISES